VLEEFDAQKDRRSYLYRNAIGIEVINSYAVSTVVFTKNATLAPPQEPETYMSIDDRVSVDRLVSQQKAELQKQQEEAIRAAVEEERKKWMEAARLGKAGFAQRNDIDIRE
jgi:hypothetical protein